jgi:hypothetical protein
MPEARRHATMLLMDEVVTGIVHWSKIHPNTGAPAHSHFLMATRTLVDPMVPKEGMGWFDRLGEPERILLTNRHHLRESEEFVDAYDCPVMCHEDGLHEFAGGPAVEPFLPGDEPAPGVRVCEVGVLTPEEVALHVATGPGALLVADGVRRLRDGSLGFFADHLLGDDPEAVKADLRAAYRRLLDELGFDVLLFAHGDPIPSGGRAALAEFAAG